MTFLVAKSTISEIVPEVCDALFDVLKDEYLRVPQSTAEWLRISQEFETRWNLPNCVGALDGKHIHLQAPALAGSTFYNYKHTNSIVLLALVDGDYNFLAVDVGCNGRISDGGVFANAAISRAMASGELNWPAPRPLPGEHQAFPYYIVADAAFPLKPYIMKPYPQRALDASKRVYNYRISRARRVVENAFGILSSRFRVFGKPLSIRPSKADSVVLAACALHNFLRMHSRDSYTAPGTFDTDDLDSGCTRPGRWRQSGDCAWEPLQAQGTNTCTRTANALRAQLQHYVSNAGAVQWQWRSANIVREYETEPADTQPV